MVKLRRDVHCALLLAVIKDITSMILTSQGVYQALSAGCQKSRQVIAGETSNQQNTWTAPKLSHPRVGIPCRGLRKHRLATSWPWMFWTSPSALAWPVVIVQVFHLIQLTALIALPHVCLQSFWHTHAHTRTHHSVPRARENKCHLFYRQGNDNRFTRIYIAPKSIYILIYSVVLLIKKNGVTLATVISHDVQTVRDTPSERETRFTSCIL